MASLVDKYGRGELLKAAKASPEVVGRHDKQAWLSLFAREAMVEDPVGTRPHRAKIDSKTGNRNIVQLDRFYETFIAPNDIRFEVYQDIVVENMVFRDVDIHIKSSTGLVTKVPTYILYEYVEEGGQLKLARLAAHWELIRNVKTILSKGWAGMKMMVVFGIKMPIIQKPGGIWGYMKGMRGVHGGGKDKVEAFVKAVRDKDDGSLKALFAAEHHGIEFPVGGQTYDPSSFATSADARIATSDLISAGFKTAFRIDGAVAGSGYHGLGLFDFDAKSKKIQRARFFWEA